MVIAMRALHVRRIQMRLMRIKRRERNPLMDCVDLKIENKLVELELSRYMRRKKYRKRAFNMYNLDKDSTRITRPDSQPHLNSIEFKQKYRMTRENFINLLELNQNHPLFGKVNSKGPPGHL